MAVFFPNDDGVWLPDGDGVRRDANSRRQSAAFDSALDRATPHTPDGSPAGSAQTIRLLLVEDDPAFREAVTRWMRHRGHTVVPTGSAEAAIDALADAPFDVVLVDLHLPGMTGLELLQRLRLQPCGGDVVVLTGYGRVEDAVEAMRLGASDYLTKPAPLEDLETRCLSAARRARTRSVPLRPPAGGQAVRLIGASPVMQDVLRFVARIAPTEKTVLICGESGVGKALLAATIHQQSRRSSGPFLTVNCGSLQNTPLDLRQFLPSAGGTLFLDEVGELPVALQPILLQILEHGELPRLEGVTPGPLDARVLAATNHPLEKAVETGRFRDDLYYRLNALSVRLPPLRDRPEDIPALIGQHLPVGVRLSEPARQALLSYAWPGNVRQLANALDRALLVAAGGVIGLGDLPPEVTRGSGPRAGRANDSPVDDLAAHERAHIETILRRVGGNKTQAARILGIHRRKLYRLIERFGIEQTAGG
ncbi:MAG: sigma-54-dependent Fis family transcriptional regulator [Planctomyces sp.]|nr:sigma-54-dependent Fis family transcriptional regulator [Planctomyces sp.]